MASIYENKTSAEMGLIHAKQMSSYDLIISRKKGTLTQLFSCGICETLKNSAGCF